MSAREQTKDPRFKPGRKAVLLIDQFEDEIVESMAWVEVYDPRLRMCSHAGCRTAEDAVELIERHYPLEDRDEAESYACMGEQVWMMPDAEIQDDGTFMQVDGGNVHVYEWPEVPFTQTEDPRDPFALKFWVVRVICQV